MRYIIVLLLFSVLFSCSSINRSEVSEKSKVPEFVTRIKKLSKIQKLDNWQEEYWHNGILYSADGLKLADNKNDVSNRIFVYIKESELSISDYIKERNEYRTQNYNAYKVDIELKETINGPCYVESIKTRKNEKYYKELINFYKYRGDIYVISYWAEVKHYKLYLNEAKTMMNSFEITKRK